MEKFKKLSFLYPTILVVIAVVVCVFNYTPGTWLTGWDTLHHEFNFLMNMQRDFTATWRAHQGLGAVAGHSHSADLIRQIILLVLSIILDKQFLRYAYIFLTLIVGPLGVYFYLKKIIFSDSRDKIISLSASFLGGLFYMLNLGTLQQFIVPFEMFNALYAFMPFVLLFGTLFYQEGKKKHLWLFVIFNLLLAPSAYAATLYYAFFLLMSLYFGLLFIVSLIVKDDFKSKLTRLLVIGLLPLLLNSFWILPNLYFVKTYSSNVSEARINYLFSEEAFLKNKKAGGFKDVSIIRNFLFDWEIYDGDEGMRQVLREWQDHLENPLVISAFYSFFAIAVLGVIHLGVKKSRIFFPLTLMFGLSMFFIMNVNPPFGFIFEYLREHISLVREGLRFPFTKFSVQYIFTYSVLFSLGMYAIFTFVSRLFHKATAIVTVTIAAVIIFASYPAFTGNYISKYLRIDIPNEYFEMFAYFDTLEKDARVATLPAHTLWGWTYYDWGYQGSGFLQFGIKQPLMDRDFDRWNLDNEEFFKEYRQAIVSEDPELFSLVLDKYRVQYLLYDKSLIEPNAAVRELPQGEMLNFIYGLPNLNLVRSFGHIDVFENRNVTYLPTSSGLREVKSATIIDPIDTLSVRDDYYISNGNYIYLPSKSERDYTLSRESFSDNILNLKFSSNKLSTYYSKEDYIPVSVYYKKIDGFIKIKIVPGFVSNNRIDLSEELEFSTPDTTDLVLKVGQSKYIAIPVYEQAEYALLGNAMVQKPEEDLLSVEVYARDNDNSKVISFFKENLNMYNCSAYEESNQLFGLGIENANTVISLSGKNVRACYEYGVNIAYEDIPYLISVSANISDGVKSCYVKNGKRICSASFINATSEDSVKVSLVLDSEEGSKEVLYGPAMLNVYKLEKTISTNLENIFASYSAAPEEELSLNTMLRHSAELDLSEKSIPESCSKSIYRSDLQPITEAFSTGQEYSTIDGNICTTYSYENAYPKADFQLLNLVTLHEQGLPFRVCMRNLSSYVCDLFTQAHDSESLKEEYFLVSTSAQDADYLLILENYSIGDTETINSFFSAKMSYFPSSFVSSLLYKQNQVDYEWMYTNDASFNSGWKLFCGIRECADVEHGVLNGWSNVWLSQHRLDNAKVVFLPYGFQYIGFFLLASSLVFVIIYSEKDKR